MSGWADTVTAPALRAAVGWNASRMPSAFILVVDVPIVTQLATVKLVVPPLCWRMRMPRLLSEPSACVVAPCRMSASPALPTVTATL